VAAPAEAAVPGLLLPRQVLQGLASLGKARVLPLFSTLHWHKACSLSLCVVLGLLAAPLVPSGLVG